MIAGYWNEPELNAKSFVNIGGTTYYKTGDIGEYLLIATYMVLSYFFDS